MLRSASSACAGREKPARKQPRLTGGFGNVAACLAYHVTCTESQPQVIGGGLGCASCAAAEVRAPAEADAFNLCSRQLIPEMVDFQSPLRASAIWWPHQQTFFAPQYPTQSLARMMHVCAMARNCSGRLGIYQDVWVLMVRENGMRKWYAQTRAYLRFLPNVINSIGSIGPK